MLANDAHSYHCRATSTSVEVYHVTSHLLDIPGKNVQSQNIINLYNFLHTMFYRTQ